MKTIKIHPNNEWNYLKDDGTYLLDKHVFCCYNFNEGFGVVQYDYYEENYVNEEGKILLKTNFDKCYNFNNGFAFVEINYICFYIDKESNFYNKDKVSFKELYNEYHNMRSELIKIIEKYTYHDVNEYFNI